MTVRSTKLCECCHESFSRPTGTNRISDQRWSDRRHCSHRCVFYNSARGGPKPSFDATYANAKVGCDELLRRSIRYGLRRDSHLGMGAAAFMARARELGLVPKNHGEPPEMLSLGSPVSTSGGVA